MIETLNNFSKGIFESLDYGMDNMGLAQIGYFYIDIPGEVRFISALLIIFLSYALFYLRKRMKGANKSIAIAEPTLSENIPSPAKSGAIQARWEEIKRHSSSSSEAEWKLAVIEADKLVGDILAKAGYPGETMGERLMGINSGQLATIQLLWEAHKVRNKIAHDSEYFLRDVDARRAVENFESALKELQAL